MTDYCYYCMSELRGSGAICPECGKGKSDAVPAHHLLPGTMLNNKFRVGMALGEGGFGITYIGIDTKLDIKVAIKEFYPNGYVNRNNTVSCYVNDSVSKTRKDFFEKGRERFLKEARILAKFSGEPGVVDVRDFFEENNTAYIVMEYLDGVDLKNFLKENGTLTPDETIRLLAPVMASLKKIHKQGLIHRDISPDNIMVMGNSVKLLDFGAARNVSAEANKSLSVMLKPGYAPEEQYRSKGVQGPWTDVYALCATMYKCITGITPDDATQRVFSDDVKYPSALGVEISEDLEKAIMRGMSIHQSDRYQSVEELINGMQGVEVIFSEDDKTITASGRKVVEDEVQTRLEVPEDNLETVLGEDVLTIAPEVVEESEPEAMQEAPQKPEPKEAEAVTEKPKQSAEKNKSAEKKAERITPPASVKAAEKKTSGQKEKTAEAEKSNTKKQKTESVTAEKSRPKMQKKPLFAIIGGISLVAVVLLVIFLIPKNNVPNHSDDPGLNDGIAETEWINAMPEEDTDDIIGEDTEGTPNYENIDNISSEVPEYLAYYSEPETADADLFAGKVVVDVDGDLYQMPFPFSYILDKGWEVSSRGNTVDAGGKGEIWFPNEAGDNNYIIEIRNYADYRTIPENCVVESIDVIDKLYITDDIVVEKGMDRVQLESILPEEFTFYGNEYCYYGGGIDVEIYVSEDSDTVQSIKVNFEKWAASKYDSYVLTENE